MMNAQALLEAIDADRNVHIAFLQSFTQAPSPNPPGDTRAAAQVLVSYLRANGIEPEVIAAREELPNIVSDFVCGSEDGPRLILNGHIDVFPVADGEQWARDPWSGEIVNGRLHGRGTVDMKAGTAASFIAYTYLYRYREFLQGSLGICAVSDEETGGKWGAKYLLDQERWRGDCMINAEPGSLNTIRFGDKGSLRLTFTVTCPAAHGAYLHRSLGANRIAARLICALVDAVEGIKPDLSPELEEHMRDPAVRDAVDEAMGRGAADIMLKATLNVGVIHGGVKVNMIPDKCVFETDIRLPLGLKAEQVLNVIHGVLESYPGATVVVQEAASNPASMCAHDHPMVAILARHAEALTGTKPVAIPSLGATDCKHWRYLGVPTYVFGVSPETMAARDESVSVDEFITVLKTHALAAWEYLGGAA
ncbi:peptidase M20 (acetylornithine deacetylase) [Phlyctema vagabunda]|uniref:Peptidase M20 (Acetylornithine deacetylase) n=1 Tax=Phlyctema vagabunda TaxID=108571 RepID=A0ABR4PRU6_9HELO